MPFNPDNPDQFDPDSFSFGFKYEDDVDYENGERLLADDYFDNRDDFTDGSFFLDMSDDDD